MNASPEKLNPSLQKKTAARTIAVQSLYQQAMMPEEGLSAARQVARLKSQLKDNKDEQKLRANIAMEPDYSLLTAILSGIEEYHAAINERVDMCLHDSWTRERTSHLLLAILQSAVFELFFHKDGKHAIIIDEYTRLTRSFLGDAEVDFVYAALNKLVQKFAA